MKFAKYLMLSSYILCLQLVDSNVHGQVTKPIDSLNYSPIPGVLIVPKKILELAPTRNFDYLLSFIQGKKVNPMVNISTGQNLAVDGQLSNFMGIPWQSVSTLKLYSGYSPAHMAGFWGNAELITPTDSPFVKAARFTTSAGTDPYGYTSFEMAYGKKFGKRHSFQWFGNMITQDDVSPSSIPIHHLNENSVKAATYAPLTTGQKPLAAYFTADSTYTNPSKWGNGHTQENVSFNYTFRKNSNEVLRLIFSGHHSDMQLWSNRNSLMNASQNPHAIQTQIRLQAMWDKAIGSKGDKLSIQVNFANYHRVQQDPEYKNSLFHYGYVGQFTSLKAPVYQVHSSGAGKSFKTKSPHTGADTTYYFTQYIEQVALMDTEVLFSIYPFGSLGNANLQYLNKYGRIHSTDHLRANGGLLNGDKHAPIYDLFNTPGTIATGYSKQNEQQTGLNANYKTVKGKTVKHQLMMGVQTVVQVSRRYSMEASQLWGIMRNLALQANPQRDLSSPILHFNADGQFNDTVSYNYVAPSQLQQGNFAINLRKKLIAESQLDANGKMINANSFLQPDMYGPSFYELEMLSPDELMSITDYYGYDTYGNRENGSRLTSRYTQSPERRIGAWRKYLVSSFLQDDFEWRGIKVNAAIRYDFADDNQYTLKDPYSLFPIKTVEDLKVDNPTLASQLATGIAENAYVYVDDIKAPKKIVGYRTMDKNQKPSWFDEKGNRVADPAVLAQNTTSGLIQPYLENPNASPTNLGDDGFIKTKARHMLQPRLMVQFPFSKNSEGYITYIQTNTPNWLESGGKGWYNLLASGGSLNSPYQQPMQSRLIELGMSQKLGKASLLRFALSHSTLSNYASVGGYSYSGAYPINYRQYSSYGKVKYASFQINAESHLRWLGLYANYSLQFYQTPLDNANNIPAFSDNQCLKGWVDISFENLIPKKSFRGTGLLLMAWVQNTLPNYTTGTGKYGRIRSNYRQSQVDFTLYKDFVVKTRKVRTFISIQNVLNTLNVAAVYSYTGKPDDDGYLASAIGKASTSTALSPAAFSNYYSISMNNPNNYLMPRIFRWGVEWMF